MLAHIAHQAEGASRSLLNLLFPPRCAICHREGEWFCSDCRAQIQFVAPPICDRCGRPMHSSSCSFCRQSPLDLDGLRAVAFFEGVMREAIHCFKYQRRRELAVQFGRMLSDYLTAQPLGIDVLVPVPLHSKRERSRGYNQAALLARETALQQKLALWYNAIERTRDTPPQVGLDARARRENVHDAFEVTRRIAGARVLLIDDVCTTGATMNSCAIALKREGAASVWGLALARPRFADEFGARR